MSRDDAKTEPPPPSHVAVADMQLHLFELRRARAWLDRSIQTVEKAIKAEERRS